MFQYDAGSRMIKVLVSSCLVGSPVRYNGAHKRSDDPILERWMVEGRLVPVCPEMLGGMGINAIESLRGNREQLRAVGMNEHEMQILGIKAAGQAW